MKKIMRTLLQSKYFFSFFPVIACVAILSGWKSTNTGNSKVKNSSHLAKMTDETYPLPCNYPEGSIVNGEAATFYTKSSAPILYFSPGGGGGAYPGIPSDVVVGNNKLVVQNDGNLVLYENGVGCWSSGTSGEGSGTYALWFQTDGNLVLRNGNAANSQVLWASGITSTCANSQYAYFELQSDGNFVMRYPHETTGGIGNGVPNVNSYALGDTHTENGNTNENHKIEN